jgi:hypothetical protein
MLALLHNVAIAEDQDAVSILDGRKAVGDNKSWFYPS